MKSAVTPPAASAWVVSRLWTRKQWRRIETVSEPYRARCPGAGRSERDGVRFHTLSQFALDPWPNARMSGPDTPDPSNMAPKKGVHSVGFAHQGGADQGMDTAWAVGAGFFGG